MSQAADRIREFVRRNPKEPLTALLHHLTPAALEAAYRRLKRDAAAGVDGVSWRDYEQGLDGKLHQLWQRVQQGTHQAVPVRRVNIPKPDGGERPLGIAALEDKIVQRALVDVVLNPIYEEEFLGFSYGFRPGRRAHDALDALAYVIERRKVSWIVDCDIRRYFDEMNRDWMIRFLEHRIGDRRVIRLIGRWLRAGVMEDGQWSDTGKGSPQGAIISPVLANLYLHHVLDQWMDRKWRKHAASGEVYIVRYADDCAPRRRAGRAEALRAAVLRKRWREALRSRRAGGGCKPPTAAALKRRGGERVRKRQDIDLVRYGSWSRTQVNR